MPWWRIAVKPNERRMRSRPIPARKKDLRWKTK